MSRRCELTGKGPQVGHKVSHSNIKTKRRFLPNLLNVTLISDALGRSVRLRVSANAFKSVDHRGGLDAFLAKAKDAELSPKALDIKRQIAKKKAAARGEPRPLPLFHLFSHKQAGFPDAMRRERAPYSGLASVRADRAALISFGQARLAQCNDQAPAVGLPAQRIMIAYLCDAHLRIDFGHTDFKRAACLVALGRPWHWPQWQREGPATSWA